MTETELVDLLHRLEITCTRYDHPPVYTCEEAAHYLKDASGAGTKNLFLHAEKTAENILLMVSETKRVDINALGRRMAVGKLRFGSPEQMLACLGIEPGAVTLLAVLNDIQNRVTVWIDRDLWASEGIQCHPLTNTATLVLSPSDLEKVLAFSDHPFSLVDIPTRN